MRYGLIGSIIFHFLVLGVVIFNFTGSKKEPPPPTLVSVEMLTPKDFSERQAGKADGKVNAPPTPPAAVIAPDAAASAKKESEQKPPQKPGEKDGSAPPPPATVSIAPPPPVEVAKAEPPPAPVEKPAEKPKVADKPAPKPAPKPEPKKVTKPKPKPEPKKAPEPETRHTERKDFDPRRIQADIAKDDPRSSMETVPAKTYSDRPAPQLNRDPKAGVQPDDYDPSKPWRPASSLQEQAMGVPGATGSMNAGTCVDAIQSRIEQHWILPIGGVGAESAIIRLRIKLKRDGYLAEAPSVMDHSPAQQAMEDAALRAAESAQPFSIPPQQYEQCRDLILRFNPREMYGAG